MNSVQREEELERLAKLASDEARHLRAHVRQGEYSRVESILAYIAREIGEYLAAQKETAR